MINKLGWQGEFVIQIRNKDTGEITEERIKNRVMDTVLNQLSETLLGNSTDLEIKYLALGTDDTPITDTDTQLGAEIFRTPPSVASARTATGSIETEFIVLDTEAVANIEEIGIFVGSTAGAGANTGTLLSRILWKKNKTDSEEFTFKRIDRIGRG
jgi:hypothetical protein